MYIWAQTKSDICILILTTLSYSMDKSEAIQYMLIGTTVLGLV